MAALHHFRIAALFEGWSYLVLLFIAMPLKYAAGMPLAVRIVGSVHGFLYSLAPFARSSSIGRWREMASAAGE
ncbi:MAG TPA: DUF3817 domain-containing protein [Vicinamibacterales bacterium]|nr:DUF3817 domain-containing protein [Vicinamibacterales bacterium]